MKQLKDNTNYCVYNANLFDSEKTFKIKKKKKICLNIKVSP